MEIKVLLKKDLMIMDLKATTKMEAIDEMVAKLKEKNVPFELHIFEKGEHGLALCDRTTSRQASHPNNNVFHWFVLFEEWLSDYID